MFPRVCADMHCDKHVVKMIIEYAQILSTAHRVLDGNICIELSKNNRKIKRYKLGNKMDDILYKSTHVNHPCGIWVRQTILNYSWLYELFICLCDEYTNRYKKIHLTDQKLRNILKYLPKNLNGNNFTKFPQAMPEEIKALDVTVSYRQYYLKYKKDIATWKNKKPFWFNIEEEFTKK
jgi:hypothetical protein